MAGIEEMVHMMVERGASDLHLVVGTYPQLRIDGQLMSIEEIGKLLPDYCQQVVYSVLTDEQKKRFESVGELDLSFGIKGVGRIRMNVFRQRGTVGAALRSIPSDPKSFEEIGLPSIVHKVVALRQGLVLVTGPTGSGKTTTLAAMIDYINMHRGEHIITIEDPIEFIHRHKISIVAQREVGSDTMSFGNALKYILRQDPDVILVGEMRDLETIQMAMTAAETGHLVFATLHTPDAVQSINRIIDVFPSHQQPQARSQLSFVLEAVFCQRLLPRKGGRGRVLVCEIMIATPAVRNLIREEKSFQIYNVIQGGGAQGMQTMNMSLADLVVKGMIEEKVAMEQSSDPKDLRALLERRLGKIG
ncbi:TPA: type IV pili twitching motility protein PilT [bacterium]|nr:type IV pili twitching motility protein PilT [bacterium]